MKNNLYKKLPESPGVYLMKDASGRILYIGKAANLKRRVSSYFAPLEAARARSVSAPLTGFMRAHDVRIEKLVSQIAKIDYKKTDSSLEALILEAQLIKQYQPPFNIKEKDNKSFLRIEITKDDFPLVFLVRGNGNKGETYGPFVYAASAREALKILRRIFPWSLHPREKVGKFSRPCFDYEIGLCPGTCIGAISRNDYLQNIKKLRLFLGGRKKELLRSVEKEMKEASKKMEFEKAAKLRRQLFALRHIRDTALISDDRPETSLSGPQNYRVEGYDISNISGTSAVGSMVVFVGADPSKKDYRKFKIRTVVRPDDTGMLKEVLQRRFGRASSSSETQSRWPLPDLVLIDGGKGQVGVARKVLSGRGLKIPVLGIAKGPKRKKNEFIGKIPDWSDEKTLIFVRDEAHRFAVSYHKALRGRNFMN